jgi:hypothetical protein
MSGLCRGRQKLWLKDIRKSGMKVDHFKRKEEDNEEISALFNDHIIGSHVDRALLLIYTRQCPLSKALPGY